MINKYLYFDSLPSTNTYLKDNYSTLPTRTICVTYNQTMGKGRLGRSWETEEGKNIALSILIKEELDISKIPLISLVVGVSLHKVLKEYLDNLSIKWPNDILVNNKKIVGILLEGITNNQDIALIIGIGINVNQSKFNDELNATSLFIETKKEFDLKEIETKVYNQVLKELNLYLNNDNSYLNYLDKHLYKLHEKIDFIHDNYEYSGIIQGIDDSGRLIIKLENEIKYYQSGEIKIIR